EEGAEPRLYADPTARAALLLQRAGTGKRREQTSLANYYSCEHGALVRGGADRDAALAEIAGAIAAETPRWDAIRLTGLDRDGAEFGALAAAFRRAGMIVRPFFDFGTWFEETRGLDFAAYAAQRPSQLLNTEKRKRKRFAGSCRLRLALYDGPAGLDEGIADYERIYRSSWKGSEPHPRFMPSLMRRCAALGALRLAVYRLDGEPAAAQFWILWRGRATIFKLAHDERFAEFSLGTLLTMAMMEHVLEADKPVEINFGRGDDPYKRLWLPQRRERWGLLAANPRTPRGLALGLRETAGRAYRMLRPAASRQA
ncbi:MAG: GNAT family N-acetyltransferase, partial [Alphaproteobacteria bacterium]|nr:GNAT family N-acetyltransferase [Alphaproteobacteria bacterium]